MNRRRILFVAYGGGHISMVLPVIRALRATRPDIDCVLLALTTGWGRARAEGFDPLGYKDLLHLADAEGALAWGEKLRAENSSPDVSAEETAAYLGVNYLELEERFGAEIARANYAAHGRYGFFPLNFMRRVILHFAPDVVVSTNSPRSEQASLEAAVSLGVPSVGMVDLFGMDSDTYVQREVKPDWTCVIAGSVRDRLLARGFAPCGVVVTGNPAFDSLFTLAARESAQRFIAARGWEGRDIVLYIGAWEPVAHPGTNVPPGRSFPIEVEGILRDYVRTRPNVALVVRYHPSDWFEYPRHPYDPAVHFSEPPVEPIHPLILASSVVVNTNSTVGLEAAIAGKPVVSIENSPSVHHWFSLASLGVSHPSPTHWDLPRTLDEVLYHRRGSDVFRSDGLAAERVADVVLGAIGVGA